MPLPLEGIKTWRLNETDGTYSEMVDIDLRNRRFEPRNADRELSVSVPNDAVSFAYLPGATDTKPVFTKSRFHTRWLGYLIEPNIEEDHPLFYVHSIRSGEPVTEKFFELNAPTIRSLGRYHESVLVNNTIVLNDGTTIHTITRTTGTPEYRKDDLEIPTESKEYTLTISFLGGSVDLSSYASIVIPFLYIRAIPNLSFEYVSFYLKRQDGSLQLLEELSWSKRNGVMFFAGNPEREFSDIQYENLELSIRDLARNDVTAIVVKFIMAGHVNPSSVMNRYRWAVVFKAALFTNGPGLRANLPFEAGVHTFIGCVRHQYQDLAIPFYSKPSEPRTFGIGGVFYSGIEAIIELVNPNQTQINQKGYPSILKRIVQERETSEPYSQIIELILARSNGTQYTSVQTRKIFVPDETAIRHVWSGTNVTLNANQSIVLSYSHASFSGFGVPLKGKVAVYRAGQPDTDPIVVGDYDFFSGSFFRYSHRDSNPITFQNGQTYYFFFLSFQFAPKINASPTVVPLGGKVPVGMPVSYGNRMVIGSPFEGKLYFSFADNPLVFSDQVTQINQSDPYVVSLGDLIQDLSVEEGGLRVSTNRRLFMVVGNTARSTNLFELPFFRSLGWKTTSGPFMFTSYGLMQNGQIVFPIRKGNYERIRLLVYNNTVYLAFKETIGSQSYYWLVFREPYHEGWLVYRMPGEVLELEGYGDSVYALVVIGSTKKVYEVAGSPSKVSEAWFRTPRIPLVQRGRVLMVSAWGTGARFEYTTSAGTKTLVMPTTSQRTHFSKQLPLPSLQLDHEMQITVRLGPQEWLDTIEILPDQSAGLV